jgi:glycosyltransferase involved in cell wall biosynthesis
MPRVAKSVYINGRFLSQRLTGVQRFAYEMVKAIDHQLMSEELHQDSTKWFIIAPPQAERGIRLRRIQVRHAGVGKGHLWDQTILPLVTRDGLLVNLANTGPLLHSKSITIIHDAAVFRTPSNYSRSYRNLHRALGYGLSRRSHLGTVSEFSRSELAEVFRMDPASIFVVPNGGEHIAALTPDEAIITRLGLTPNKYFLFVGSPSPNKNLESALKAFSNLNQISFKFAVVGSAKHGVFRSSDSEMPPGVVLCGPATDSEIAALYRNASALVFPSIYEGFGIPPLEAMEHGCAVLASDIPPVREVCGDAAIYFSPLDIASIASTYQCVIDGISEVQLAAERGRERCKQFSWAASAQRLIKAVEAAI